MASACDAVSLASETLTLLYQSQTEARIEYAAVMSTATCQAGDCAFDPVHTRKIALAIWTSVEIAASESFRRERKRMAALFASDTKIAARLLPFNPMRQDSATSSAKLRQQMRKLVPQCAIDFDRMLKQPRIQPNEFLAIISTTRSCF